MSKRGWLGGWIGLGVLIGCGVQAVDYPDGDGGAGGGGVTKPADVGAPCTTDAQCNGRVCVNGQCGNCASNAQCKDPTKPVCDTASGVCGPCTTSSQCADGLACVSGQCSACTSNEQCPAGQVCANGKCGPCQATSQCTQPQQCLLPQGVCTSGTGGDSGVTITDSGPGFDACATGSYAGLLPGHTSVWGTSLAAAAGGKVGKAAGDNACNLTFAGSHVCTWQELKTLDTCGKLIALKNTTTNAWLHRDTPETANGTTITFEDGRPAGQTSAGTGAANQRGGSCDDWRYGTNHIADGEFVEFGGGTMIARLDGDTASDDTYNGLGYPSNCGANPCVSHAVSGKLECGGVTRAILCCK